MVTRITDASSRSRHGAPLPVPVGPRPPLRQASQGLSAAPRPVGRPAGFGSAARPRAAFLAQLALQYDDLPALRRARRERVERAARAYARGATIDNPADGTCRRVATA